MNEADLSFKYLEESLRMVEPERFVRVYLDEGDPMKSLLQRAQNEARFSEPQMKRNVLDLLEEFDGHPIDLSSDNP